jgi:hypothetical protein
VDAGDDLAGELQQHVKGADRALPDIVFDVA